MKRASQRLQTVLKLAKLREQAAAQKLAESTRNYELQLQQQQQFHHYQLEYNSQYKEFEQVPVHALRLENYQRFYENLQDAKEGVQERVMLSDSQREQARFNWQQQYAKQKNMSKLIDKKKQQEEREDEQKSQREQDDRPRKR